MKRRVAVGLSGGVDSSVTAALLKEQGYEVTGVFIEAYNEPGCRTDEDRKDAIAVATRLEISCQILDFRKEYKETVVKYFFDEYRAGRTPNPDVVCNREVKFGLFYDWALRLNSFAQGYNHEPFDFVATGHYARITKDGYLHRPKDLTKDQSYFLWQVPRANLGKILWPLGEITKKEVRTKAHELQFANADKPDSMGVCMMGELNVSEFLKSKLGENPGEIVWKDRIVGKHAGLWFYTLGQRGGWEYNDGVQTELMPSLYVVGKNVEKNQLLIGEHEEAWRREWSIDEEKWEIGKKEREKLVKENQLLARIRNLGELVPVMAIEGGRVTVEKPLYGPAPGQSTVFYDQRGVVVGGGIIC